MLALGQWPPYLAELQDKVILFCWSAESGNSSSQNLVTRAELMSRDLWPLFKLPKLRLKARFVVVKWRQFYKKVVNK